MKLLILIRHRFELWTPPAWFVPKLQREFPQVKVLHFQDYAQAEPEFADADAMITWSLRPEQFALARQLRWIHSTAAAVHPLMIPEIVASDVVITNASSVQGPVVAEHAIALILALAHCLPSARLYQQQHVWGQELLWKEKSHPREVNGATLGLVGTGAIGGEVAKRALALGMRVLAVREHPERGADFLSPQAAPAAVEVLGFNDLEQVIAASDFLILATPVTPKTKNMFNAERLKRMKPDGFLINVGRGALVDENVLAAVLRERCIGGAALDVFDREPLPADSPLWDLPNLIITPHSGAFTEKMWDRHYALFSENLRRFLEGQPLVGVVDKKKGY